MTIEGIVQRSSMGRWTLTSRQGKTYEIYKNAPQDLLQLGLRVRVSGEVRQDVISMAGIGQVLEVNSFELLSP